MYDVLVEPKLAHRGGINLTHVPVSLAYVGRHTGYVSCGNCDHFSLPHFMKLISFHLEGCSSW